MNHRQIVRAVADRDGLRHRNAHTFRPCTQGIQFDGFRDDVSEHPARQPTIRGFETVRDPIIKMRVLCQTVHDLMESAGDHADLPPVPVQLVNQRKRAIGEMHAMVYLIENRRGHALQQRDAGPQRLAEIQLAVHGARGHRGDAFPDARSGSQFVDDLFVDQRGIHVHDQQPGAGKRRRGVR